MSLQRIPRDQDVRPLLPPPQHPCSLLSPLPLSPPDLPTWRIFISTPYTHTKKCGRALGCSDRAVLPGFMSAIVNQEIIFKEQILSENFIHHEQIPRINDFQTLRLLPWEQSRIWVEKKKKTTGEKQKLARWFSLLIFFI